MAKVNKKYGVTVKIKWFLTNSHFALVKIDNFRGDPLENRGGK